jgi:cytochrome c oxidase subunit 2
MNLGNLYIVGAVVGVIVLTTLLGALLAGAASFLDSQKQATKVPKKEKPFVQHQSALFRAGQQLGRAPGVLLFGAFAIGLLVISVLAWQNGANIPMFPPKASLEAVQVDEMFYIFIGASVFVLLLVEGLIVYIAIRYRKPKNDNTDGQHFTHSNFLEVSWTIVPVILVLFLTVISFRVLDQVQAEKPDAMLVNVTAQSFFFTFEYPEYKITSNDLYLPVGKAVRFDITSVDVLHAFWVPVFRLKQDAIPGEVVTVYNTPQQIGTYRVVCAELCGVGHGQMGVPSIDKPDGQVGGSGSLVYVLSQTDFDSWVAEQQASARNLNQLILAQVVTTNK